MSTPEGYVVFDPTTSEKSVPIIEPLSSEWSQKLDQYFDVKALVDPAKVTISIPTKDRYETLVLTLLSVANQTYKNMHVIIVDDSTNGQDLRNFPAYQSVFQLFNAYNITWEVVWGRKMGQHHSHQLVQEKATTKFIWRIDDDEIAESNVLAKLMGLMEDEKVGAAGGLVPQHVPIPPMPSDAKNIIANINLPNIQWFKHADESVKEVEHLTSSFVYRRGLVSYEMGLSPASFREETLLTHEIKRKGYKLLVDPLAVTWHFRSPQRYGDKSAWDRDDRLFQEKLRNWGTTTPTGATSKIVVLDCGKGDHVIIKSLLPELKKKYSDLTLAVCFPDVFAGDDVKLISIAEAIQILGQIDSQNIYRFMIDKHWTGSLQNAYRALYEL